MISSFVVSRRKDEKMFESLIERATKIANEKEAQGYTVVSISYRKEYAIITTRSLSGDSTAYNIE